MVHETCRDKAERLALVRDLSLVRDPPQRQDFKSERRPLNTLAVRKAKRCPNRDKDGA